jgi:hypothetical protein
VGARSDDAVVWVRLGVARSDRASTMRSSGSSCSMQNGPIVNVSQPATLHLVTIGIRCDVPLPEHR